MQDSIKTKSAMDLVRDAKQIAENLSPLQVKTELLQDDVTLIDIREAEELKQGHIPGAIHAARGMLEFFADPDLPYHKPEFDRDKRLILYCASGNRSALAIQTLYTMGYRNIAHIDGGLKAWKEAGLPIVE